jgi:hypothetical protein
LTTPVRAHMLVDSEVHAHLFLAVKARTASASTGWLAGKLTLTLRSATCRLLRQQAMRHSHWPLLLTG